MDRLRRRRDFLAAAQAPSVAMPGLVVQVKNRHDDKPPRVGFTCSKKIGNAVTRNRAKRRLRELVRLYLTEQAVKGYDYVLIGRMATAERAFTALRKDLELALGRVPSLAHCRQKKEKT